MAKKTNNNLAQRLFSPQYFRHRLAYTDALPQMSLLGLIAGVAAALIIIAFRSLFELPLAHWLPAGTAEGFESLPPIWHLLLPIIGGALLGGWLMLFKAPARQTGVTHVMIRMVNHKGYMPFKNTLVQFVGGALAIISGQSAGREGPAVHLGAAISSQLGRYWHLPDNSIRMLIGCGTAGAIAASFNTPMAGVIFAMEVVMLEYTIIGFTPIIIAAVTATLVHNSLYGAEMAFMAPAIDFVSLQELPLILLYGVVLGALAALFTKVVTSSLRLAHKPVMLRMLGAGVVTGLLATQVPQIMGMGTDSILAAIEGQYAIQLLLMLALAKLLATAISVGLGMPIGLIGPTLLIGASAGGALGLISQQLITGPISAPGFYAMLGMGAMMSAVLQAPLAGLVALLELTHNPDIILPGMATVVIANITCRYIFKQDSTFIEVLRKQGVVFQANPVNQLLAQRGVVSLMNKQIAHHSDDDTNGAALTIEQGKEWLLVYADDQIVNVLPSQHIALDKLQDSIQQASTAPPCHFGFCSSRATLKEAWGLYHKRHYDYLLITDLDDQVIGVLPATTINSLMRVK
ncbi:MAG: chloride channel protein [Gammaproteobacteria bacterium]|jgi:CIC family chloride channel protein|nr:chloride channel protein [Gammaproteobacteria bacterium]